MLNRFEYNVLNNKEFEHNVVLLLFSFTLNNNILFRCSVCAFRSERFGRTRSPRIILVLLLASLALASPQAYFWLVAGTHECHVRETQLTGASFYSIWSWCTDMLIFGALPALVLVLNVCVLRKIRQAGKLRFSDSPTTHGGSKFYSRVSGKRASRANNSINTYGAGQAVDDGNNCGGVGVGGAGGGGGGGAGAAGSHASNGTTSSTSGGSHNFTATTVTLLWVSFYLIFTTLPVTIVFAIQTAIPLGGPMSLHQMGSDPAWKRYIAYYAARVIIREIGMSHHVGNVFIYLATSRRFRRQLRKRFLSGRASPCTPSANHQTETTSLHTMHVQLKPLKDNR